MRLGWRLWQWDGITRGRATWPPDRRVTAGPRLPLHVWFTLWTEDVTRRLDALEHVEKRRAIVAARTQRGRGLYEAVEGTSPFALGFMSPTRAPRPRNGRGSGAPASW